MIASILENWIAWCASLGQSRVAVLAYTMVVEAGIMKVEMVKAAVAYVSVYVSKDRFSQIL